MATCRCASSFSANSGKSSAWPGRCRTLRRARVEDLFERYGRRFPKLAAFRSSVAASVNQEYAGWRAPLSAGDEVAFLPPVSGGQQAAVETIFFSSFAEPDPLRAKSAEGLKAPEDGALVVFDGFVRNNFKGQPNAISRIRSLRAHGVCENARDRRANSREVSDSPRRNRSSPGPARNRRDERLDRRKFATPRAPHLMPAATRLILSSAPCPSGKRSILPEALFGPKASYPRRKPFPAQMNLVLDEEIPGRLGVLLAGHNCGRRPGSRFLLAHGSKIAGGKSACRRIWSASSRA